MNLREKRIEKGITQKQLAIAVGKRQSSITRFERGLNRPKPATAKKIAAVLGFDWTEFYKEEDEDEND